MRRIHIPNLFYIHGQPHQGKSSLTRHFRQSLDCEVLPTDQIFWRWCDKYHPVETREARWSLGKHFPHLPNPLKREWFEYLTDYALACTKYARPDMVMEGWLLTLLPKDLKAILHHRTTILSIAMRQYVAHTSRRNYAAEGSNYTKVVSELKRRLTRDKVVELMPLVRQQRFEEYSNCAGKSDCAGRLLAFGLPADMRGKNVLEVGCGTGYFSIRCAQRGADVWAVDTHEESVRLSARIASSIYRLLNIKFYCGDIMHENFNKPVKFDYILLLNGLTSLTDPTSLFRRLQDFLAPDGQLLVEAIVPRLDAASEFKDKVPYFKEIATKRGVVKYPNAATVQAWAGGLSLLQRTRSSQPANSMLIRVAYKFGRDGLIVAPSTEVSLIESPDSNPVITPIPTQSPAEIGGCGPILLSE
jgi:2-polyprenyl-3-methyl-5-hydroxy-6-metoxy-1,4-benzoquinol methylase